ncbi:hypothetical protein LI064_02275 [Clostridium perfringens]|uniref:hypothetical protein n=1 Tax=Clostridium perfringens TaxID=1502 RepID=UPI002245B1B8|nr:hypothetical protein [Clostridium perfringens]MCX0353348.1 hypothetical protein [Clostridium perfringens]
MNKEQLTKEFLENHCKPIKDIDTKRPEMSQIIVEIVGILSKHQTPVGNLDLIFSGVKSIVLRETKIQITKDILDKRY